MPEENKPLSLDEAVDLMSQQPDSDTSEHPGDEDEEHPTTDSDSQEEEEQDEDSDSEDQEDHEDTDEDSDDTEHPNQESEEVVFTYKDEETGEEIPVDKEEAQKGYLRQKHFTRNAQELASERAEVQAEKQAVLQEKATVVEVLSKLRQQASDALGEFAGIDWVQLQRDDPAEFEEKKAQYEARLLQYKQSGEAEEQLSKDIEKEWIEQMTALRDEEMKLLKNFVPDYNQEKADALHAKVSELYGFKPEELEQLFDHRAMRVMLDAVAYHETQDKVTSAKDKLDKTPPKSVKRGQSPGSEDKSRKEKQLRKRLNETGDINAALELMTLGKR